MNTVNIKNISINTALEKYGNDILMLNTQNMTYIIYTTRYVWMNLININILKYGWTQHAPSSMVCQYILQRLHCVQYNF